MLLNDAYSPIPLNLGRTTITPGALVALGGDRTEVSRLLRPILDRFARRDWGEVTAHDAAANLGDLGVDGRVVATYTVARVRLLVIREVSTEVTEGVLTTVLLPEEY